MTTCTEPGRWARTPGADAAEEEVALYLAHVEECPFHAAVERREEALLRGVVGHAALAQGASVPASAAPRMSPPRLALAFAALVAALLLGLALWSRNEGAGPVAKQGWQPEPDPSHVPTPAPTPAHTPEPPGVAAVAPTPKTRVKPRPGGGGKGRPGGPPGAPGPPSPAGRSTVAAVRRIYVSPGEGADDRGLRSALIAELRAGNRFTVVTSERRADAVLRPEQSRGAGVTVQLLTRRGKVLWFTTQPADAANDADFGGLAARIVGALTDAAEPRSPHNTPPR